jgi:GNAT superfamily N-acetyltransferase
MPSPLQQRRQRRRQEHNNDNDAREQHDVTIIIDEESDHLLEAGQSSLTIHNAHNGDDVDDDDDDHVNSNASSTAATTTTTTTTSLGSFHVRSIRPDDRHRIQQLHEDWFPVRYHDEFYDDLCGPYHNDNNNNNDNEESPVPRLVTRVIVVRPASTATAALADVAEESHDMSSSSLLDIPHDRNCTSHEATLPPAAFECNDPNYKTNNSHCPKSALKPDAEKEPQVPNHYHDHDTRQQQQQQQQQQRFRAALPTDFHPSMVWRSTTSASSPLPSLFSDDDCSIRQTKTKRQQSISQPQSSSSSWLQHSEHQQLPSQQIHSSIEQPQERSEEKIVACIVGCFLQIPLAAFEKPSSASAGLDPPLDPLPEDEENPRLEQESLKPSIDDTTTCSPVHSKITTKNERSSPPDDNNDDDDDDDDDQHGSTNGSHNQYHGLVNAETARLLISNPERHDTLFYIMTLGTVAEYRHFGLATQLLQWLFDVLEEEHAKCGAIYLHVLTQNQAAIRLYERHGFYRVQEIPNYYTIQGAHYNCYLYAKYFHGMYV